MYEQRRVQESIATELGVPPGFDASQEIERRVAFLTQYMQGSGAAGLVLGISGGVDSTTAGRLCQLAVERARRAGYSARFIAMRLPYGVQADAADGAMALRFIGADEVLTVDVRPASDAALASLLGSGLRLPDPVVKDFVLGNIKARQRMVTQYAVAGANGLLVVGTDHASEAVMGFYTKYGDGACDLTPLSGLTKRRVRSVARALRVPATLIAKVPTADLESGRPGLADEDVFGITYDDIDDFLEGNPVSEHVRETILRWYSRSVHKRALPVPVPPGELVNIRGPLQRQGPAEAT